MSIEDGKATLNLHPGRGTYLVEHMTPPLRDALSLLEAGDGQVSTESHKFPLVSVLVCWQEVTLHTAQPAKIWMRI